jgi:hypothetical protein
MCFEVLSFSFIARFLLSRINEKAVKFIILHRMLPA